MSRDPSPERVLIRTIAGASRKLDEDLGLSPLQAIDRLLKISAKFKEFWIHFPWLVLEGGQHLAANMPVPQMLAEIAKHGEPIGIAGVALLQEAKRYTTFKMMFRKAAKSRETLEESAETTLNVIMRRSRRMEEAFEGLENLGDPAELETRLEKERRRDR
jgi:hypothetical protein